MVTLNQLLSAMIALAVVTLVAGGAAIGVSDFKEDVEADTPSITVTNESQTSITVGTTFSLGKGWTVNSISAVRNASGAVLNTGEFSLLGAGTESYSVNITNVSSQVPTGNSSRDNETQFFFDYSAQESDEQRNISIEGVSSIDNSTQFLDTTGTILGIAVLIAIIVTAFAVIRLR